MLNNNFTLFALKAMENSSATAINIHYLGSPTNTNWNGQIKNFFDTAFASMSQNAQGAWLMIGTDGTKVSKTDYALYAPVDEADLSFANSSVSSVTNLGDKKVYSVTITYNGAMPIEINEVGLRTNVMNTNGAYLRFLVAREVITPIPVNNGDTFTVSMAIG